jgi:hypothetical protein
MSNFCPFLHLFHKFFAVLIGFSHELLASIVRSISVAVGLPVDANTIVGVSTVVDIPAVKGFRYAVDVCDAPIVSAAAYQTVANVLL